MVAPLSTHIPEFAGATEEVTGELVVDTGLREIQSLTVTIKAQNLVPDEEQFVTWYRLNEVESGAPAGEVVIRVEKGGVNSGTLGDSVISVSWMAMGE